MFHVKHLQFRYPAGQLAVESPSSVGGCTEVGVPPQRLLGLEFNVSRETLNGAEPSGQSLTAGLPWLIRTEAGRGDCGWPRRQEWIDSAVNSSLAMFHVKHPGQSFFVGQRLGQVADEIAGRLAAQSPSRWP
jgi:hypothetical protein